MEIVRDKAVYWAFCTQEERLPIFVQPWYLDAVCEGGEWQVLLVLEEDQVLASLPFFLKKKAFLHYVTMPHFVKYMGPYLRTEYQTEKASQQYYQRLIEHLPAVHFFKQNFHPDCSNWLPFYWQHFQQSTRYTHRIDLMQGLEAVSRNINRNMRRNIAKAEKIVTLEKSNDPELFFHINTMSFQRQGLATPYSKALFLKHDAALNANHARQIFLAKDKQGRIHSGAYLIWDKQAAYYHLSGDDPKLRESGSGIFLIWAAIQYAVEELRVPIFDFEGSMLPKIAAIRQQFGAYQQPYFGIWKYNAAWLRWLEVLKGKG